MSETDIVFGESTIPFLLDLFDWETDDDETIVDENGNPVESYNGHVITTDELAGVVRKDGEAVPLRDNFCDLVDHALTNTDDYK